MIDVKVLRENPKEVKAGIAAKKATDNVDEILSLDERRRELIKEADDLKSKRNTASKRIGELKREKKDAQPAIDKMKETSDAIKRLDEELREVDAKFHELLLAVPNLPHYTAPEGTSEKDNVEKKQWLPKKFSLEDGREYLDHVELGKRLGILDFERGAKIAGAGFPLYVGKGARLERALLNFMIDLHLEKHGYEEVMTPFVANPESMTGTGQLPKMADDMYRIDRDDLYLIPTAEVPITNIHRDEILDEARLPISYCGYSPCFRREAGSYGKDTRGFLRVHQFNKVEMVKFVKPEDSGEALQNLVNDAEDVLKALDIPYRVIELCAADLSFAAAKCFDIETWSPGEKKWLEASSCSNFLDFQARRASIRYRSADGKPEFVHTLNGSGLATSRLMVSLLERHQTSDGGVRVPEPLRDYAGFDVID